MFSRPKKALGGLTGGWGHFWTLSQAFFTINNKWKALVLALQLRSTGPSKIRCAQPRITVSDIFQAQIHIMHTPPDICSGIIWTTSESILGDSGVSVDFSVKNVQQIFGKRFSKLFTVLTKIGYHFLAQNRTKKWQKELDYPSVFTVLTKNG